MLRLSRAGNGDCPVTQVRLSSKSHPCRFYSALQGRAQAGWLRWKGGVGGSQLGGEVEGAPLLPWRWAPRLLSLGRGARAACACVCGDGLFPEHREGQGGAPRPRPRASYSSWEGNALFLCVVVSPSPRRKTPLLPPPSLSRCWRTRATKEEPLTRMPEVWGHMSRAGIGQRPRRLVIREAHASLSPFIRALFEMC